MEVEIKIKKSDLMKMVQRHLELELGRSVALENIHIETKSSQNYKSEWENADFRARYYSVE